MQIFLKIFFYGSLNSCLKLNKSPRLRTVLLSQLLWHFSKSQFSHFLLWLAERVTRAYWITSMNTLRTWRPHTDTLKNGFPKRSMGAIYCRRYNLKIRRDEFKEEWNFSATFWRLWKICGSFDDSFSFTSSIQKTDSQIKNQRSGIRRFMKKLFFQKYDSHNRTHYE